MIPGRKIRVLTKKEELNTVRLAGKVAVVLDLLFAISTMVTAPEREVRFAAQL